MGIFKTKQNKKYNYTPRFYKGEQSPFEIKHKFDDQRVTIQKTNLKGKNQPQYLGQQKSFNYNFNIDICFPMDYRF